MKHPRHKGGGLMVNVTLSPTYGMNFRQFMEQDEYQKAEQAVQAAKKILASGSYKDLANFYVMEYTDEELKDLGDPTLL